MNRAVLIAGVVSAVAGGGLVHAHIQNTEERILGGDLVPVVVLTKDLPPGTALTADVVTASELPARYVESRHIEFGDIEKALGMRIGLSGKAGEALLWTDLAGMQREARTLSQLVPQGMRAMPLQVGRNALGQLVRPGDTVDVLYSKGASHHETQTNTRTLLQSLLVLSVGSDLGQHEGGRTRSNIVTVSVTPAQARLLADHTRGGSLQLVLRNPDDLVLEDGIESGLQANRGGHRDSL